MRITSESGGTRWRIMLLTWVICSILVVLHVFAASEYLTLLGARGLRGAVSPETPMRQVLPATYADPQMWVRHAVASEATGDFRVRHTRADNAPHGREVHWSSPIVWLLRMAAWLEELVGSEPGARAIEEAVPWLNAPLLLGLVVVLSGWAAVRAGAGAGVIVACGMVGHARFYDGFLPANVDHHGLVNASVLGLLLGFVFMGAGWWQAERSSRTPVLPGSVAVARRGAIVSACSGAIGLWLSTASVAPVLALAGVSGLLVAVWGGRASIRAGAQFEPAVWQLWGRLGAILSVLLYLVEYAPSHFGLRLEVNHPLYALAWWGGAEAVAQLSRWHLADPGGVAPRFPGFKFACALVAAGAPLLVIMLGGRSVFLVLDPVVGGLGQFVAEGVPFATVFSARSWAALCYELPSALLVVPALMIWRVKPGPGGILTAPLSVITLATVGLGLLQYRWFQTASAAQIALLVALLSAGSGLSPGRQWRRIIVVAGACFLLPLGILVSNELLENRRGVVHSTDLLQPLYRDVAAALRRDQPSGEIVVLASPDATAGIGYFGHFSGLGTLYWENAEGLHASAGILTALSDDEARRLVLRHRVTHVVMISRGNFIGEYFRLLYPGRPLEEGHATFGYRLGTGHGLPGWLRPVPYEMPEDLKAALTIVRIFSVERAP
jgi:hypothetical protein